MARNRLFVLLVLVALLFIMVFTYAASASPDNQTEEEMTVLEFDIAERGTFFNVDESPAFEDGQPSFGAEFITQGYLYPVGTLEEGVNGVLPNGEPEFPDLVLGTWICRGWIIGDGFRTQTGPGQVTTQIFDFGDIPGSMMIVTDGIELVDVNVPFSRAIIGGTGEYASATGEQIQEILGYPPSGVHIRVTMRVTHHAES